MAERTLWNYYAAQEVKDGGFVVVQRRCVDTPQADALASFHGVTILHAYRLTREEADAEVRARNADLGDEYVPYPFERGRG